jgi:hypothetical protein
MHSESSDPPLARPFQQASPREHIGSSLQKSQRARHAPWKHSASSRQLVAVLLPSQAPPTSAPPARKHCFAKQLKPSGQTPDSHGVKQAPTEVYVERCCSMQT